MVYCLDCKYYGMCKESTKGDVWSCMSFGYPSVVNIEYKNKHSKVLEDILDVSLDMDRRGKYYKIEQREGNKTKVKKVYQNDIINISISRKGGEVLRW